MPSKIQSLAWVISRDATWQHCVADFEVALPEREYDLQPSQRSPRITTLGSKGTLVAIPDSSMVSKH